MIFAKVEFHFQLRSNPPNESASRATSLRFYSPKVLAMVRTSLLLRMQHKVDSVDIVGGETVRPQAFDFGYAEPWITPIRS